MDLPAFLVKISIWAIPALFALTLHEVAHGWMARLFGDRTAEMLGRLSLNPLRHMDPLGTVVVPSVLLAIGLPMIGWAKPVPVATSAMRHPRRAMVSVALAGPGANLLMALTWCGILAAVVHGNALPLVHAQANQTLVGWVEYMAQAGIFINVGLAVLRMLDWLFKPALRVIGRVITVLLGSPA